MQFSELESILCAIRDVGFSLPTERELTWTLEMAWRAEQRINALCCRARDVEFWEAVGRLPTSEKNSETLN